MHAIFLAITIYSKLLVFRIRILTCRNSCIAASNFFCLVTSDFWVDKIQILKTLDSICFFKFFDFWCALPIHCWRVLIQNQKLFHRRRKITENWMIFESRFNHINCFIDWTKSFFKILMQIQHPIVMILTPKALQSNRNRY